MDLQKPYNINISGQTIDAFNEDNVIRWSVSGDIPVAFKIEILRNSDGTVAWQLPKTSSYATSYTLSAGNLLNGIEYKIKITVWNQENELAFSDYEIFQTSSRPTVSMNPIGIISSPSYNFVAYYNQTEFVPLRYWSAYLYNNNEVLLSEVTLQTTTDLEYLINNLQSESDYYIEFQVTSEKGLTNTTGKVSFDVLYTQPKINLELYAENTTDAGIYLALNVVQVLGESDVELIYIDDEKIDLTLGNKIWFSDNFSLTQDFTLKIWLESPNIITDTLIDENDYLLMLVGENGKIFLQYRSDNKFHLFKKIGLNVSHYVTEEVLGTSFFVCIKQINNCLDINAEQNV